MVDKSICNGIISLVGLSCIITRRWTMVSLTDVERLDAVEARMPLREARRIGLVMPAVLARYNIVEMSDGEACFGESGSDGALTRDELQPLEFNL
jgi:hypothetical protein